MRTLLPLEEALHDTPQIRSLVTLFEEDSGNLHKYTRDIFDAVSRVLDAQNLLSSAFSHLSNVLGNYKEQKLPLDQMEYDMPDIAHRLHLNIGEMASWSEIISQQLTNCVLQPIGKLERELENVTGPIRETYHVMEKELEDCQNKFSKVHRKDSVRKLEESNNDVFFAKRNFHEIALKYYCHQNSVQFLRYTHIVEPLLSLVYAFRSYFQMGHDGLTQKLFTEFLTQTQEQIQSIHGEYKEESGKMREIQRSVEEVRKLEPNMYYEDIPQLLDGALPPPSPQHNLTHKQGYMNLKSKTGFISRWERYFFFTQGTHLMCQGKNDLAGQVLMDLDQASPQQTQEKSSSGAGEQSSRSVSPLGPTVATFAEHEDRRNTFLIAIGPTEEHNKPRQFLLQAPNVQDLLEWVTVINNLAGTPCDIGGTVGGDEGDPGSPSATSKPITMSEKEEPHTPSQTPASYIKGNFHTEANRSTDPAHHLSSQPIQFDIVGDDREASPEAPEDHSTTATSDEKSPHRFSVRFLGSMEVLTDRGDRMVHETIRQIMTARAVHSIFKANEKMLVIDDAENRGRLLLVDHASGEGDGSTAEKQQQEAAKSGLVSKVAFPLEDLAYWTVHPDNDRLFAFIARAKVSPKGPRQRPKFLCYVFEAHKSGGAVCKALTEGTRKAFQALLVRKTSSSSAEPEKQSEGEGDGGTKSGGYCEIEGLIGNMDMEPSNESNEPKSE